MKVKRLMDQFDYCGVLTLEFFLCNGKLIANEYAPRVHNSGHWTIEGAQASQFENHLRAICDLSLESALSKGNYLMLNLIGSDPGSINITERKDLALHNYKKRPRPGRKTGHLTMKLNTNDEWNKQLKWLESQV